MRTGNESCSGQNSQSCRCNASLRPAEESSCSIMENLEEDLTCSVCYSLFSDPRVLPCSHTFCRTCLDNLLQASTNYSIWRPLRLPIKCPNCRSVVELPPTGVDTLPINVSLRAIIEKFQRDSEPRPPSCQEHHRQPLNMFCVQDRQLICGLCLTVGRHQGHPIDDLQAAFVREKRTPLLLLARLSEQRWAQVCELAEQLEQDKARCEALVRQDRQEVDQFFLSLEGVLARKKRACLEALDKAAAEVSRVYDPLIHRVKELQEEQLDLVSLGSSVDDEDSPLVFLEKVHLFRERVERFINTPLPSAINLSVSPRAAAFLQQHWPAVTVGGLDRAPVPELRCCSRCGTAQTQVEVVGPLREARSGRRELQPVAVLLGVVLLVVLVATLWVNLVSGASLGFSLSTRFGQFIDGLSSDLLMSVWRATEVAVVGWSSQLCSVKDQVLQQADALFQSLTSG